MPVVIDVAFYYYPVGEPHAELSGGTPHVEHFRVDRIVFIIGVPDRQEMHPVAVGAVHVGFENQVVSDLFKQPVVFRAALAVVVEFGEQYVSYLRSRAKRRVTADMAVHCDLNAVARFHCVQSRRA